MKTAPDQHILLTSLGTRAIETTYQWEDRTETDLLTPLALVKLLDPSQRPNRVVAMVTKGAEEKTWELFKNGISATLGFEPESISIPDGISDREIRQILEQVAQEIPEDAKLTLDVTQGMRHFPFIFYALVLYLQSLRNVEVLGAYYGMIEGTSPAPKPIIDLQLAEDTHRSQEEIASPAPKPIIDLQPLLALPEWSHAVRMFRDQGTTLDLARLLKPLEEKLSEETGALFKADNKEAGRKCSAQRDQVRQAVEWLEKHAFAYESALPLELGKASSLLIDPIEHIADMNASSLPPLFADLTDTIADVSKKAAFVNPILKKGKWKQNISLDEHELKRQARMIDLYLERDQLPLAVGLMREWVVSWAIIQDAGQPQNWLEPPVRSKYERSLGALGAFVRGDQEVEPEQRDFGNFWNQLTQELRNALHHHGMREEALEEPPKSLEEVRDFWDKLKAGKIDLPQLGGGRGKLLLSPQGTRPGVLFSALKVAQPATCLVICSDTSESSITVAAERAGFEGDIALIKLKDPHGGFDEIDKAAKHAGRHLLTADEVLANMTGGTTLMGLVVQRLVEESQKLDRKVQRFALIDRRPPAEQDSDPFVQSDCHWLDD